MTGSNDRSNPGDKPTVRAQRRRPSGTPTSGAGRERAATPRREGRADQPRAAQPSAQAPRPTQARPRNTSGGSSGGGAGQLGGQLLKSLVSGGASRGGATRSRLPGLLVLALVACAVIYMLSKCGGLGQTALPAEPAIVEQAPTLAPTLAPQPAVAPISGAPSSWLVMLYQDADDKILEKDIYLDLNEAERVGSSDSVRIVTQIDRFSGGFSDDGNWTGARRYEVTRDDDLTRVGSSLVADLGEVNMGAGDTLVDFVTWAVDTYPADKLVLILSDHGLGWPGGWSDPAPAARSNNATPLGSVAGNQLYLDELDAALQTIRQRTGVEQFELIGLDACLMGQLEVFSMLAPHARYAVASEETEPGLGWAYASFLQALTRNPAMTGGELSRLIVESYVTDDQRIVDDAARAEMLQRGSPMGGLFGLQIPTSAQVADQMGRDVTLSAVDLSRLPALTSAVNELCLALQNVNQRPVAKARNYAQTFTNIFGDQAPPAYIDLGNWLQLLRQEANDPALTAAADQTLLALQQALVAERHGAGKPGATGIAIYYPNSALYRNPATGPASYTAIASRFSQGSLWDDFLAFHYTGREFQASDQQAAVPAPSASLSAPGRGEIQVSAVTVSGQVAAPGQPIVLSAEISGENIGHILFFAGYLDQQSNSLYVADMDYMESENTRGVDGVYYPVWPDSAFTLEFEWEPLVYYLSDGYESVPVLLMPDAYGATDEQAVYTIDGVYTFASGETRRARLYLANGQLQRVIGYTGNSGAEAPREIYPQTNDSFTIYDRWLDLDAQGRVIKQAAQEGGTLTFSDQMFIWQELDAAAGEYVVGFTVKDLDGNQQQAFTQVTVR